MADIAQDVDFRGIAERLDSVRERIERACARGGRKPEDVTLVGVTKTFPIEAVCAAREAGLRHFGENRAQDLVEKVQEVPGRRRGGDVEWHMIGHLQRNKAKDVVEYADCFHALDSPRLARELDKRAAHEDRVMPCFVQVNVSGENSKYGLAVPRTHAFLDDLAGLEHIRVIGLMTMASFVENPEDVRSEFRQLRTLFDTYADRDRSNVNLLYLSMGMSNDFEVAVEEGATHVRIGSAIFGAREH